MDGYPCHVKIDDILVTGKTEVELEKNLDKVLNQLRQINLKFSARKCVYKRPNVVYIGHNLSDQGLKPDPAKVKAIAEFPEQTNKKLLRFLGMTKYLAKFTEDRSE